MAGDRPSPQPRTPGSPHGRPTSWALVSAVVLAFAVGGSAIAVHLWWLFWTCVGVVVLAVPAGWGIGIMKDTVEWETVAAVSDSSTEAPPASSTEAPPASSTGAPPDSGTQAPLPHPVSRGRPGGTGGQSAR
jgi:hypothetical protein